MKNENVKKINKIGKVSRIVIMVVIVLCSISLVVSIIGSIVSLASAPSFGTLIKVSGNGTGEVEIDTSFLPFMIDEDDIDVNDFNFDMFGIKLKFEKNEIENGVVKMNADFGIDGLKFNSSYILGAISISLFVLSLTIAAFIIVFVFALKFAKSLEICSSPFESNVIRRMKNLGFSLIPLAIVKCISGTSIATIILFVIIILLLIYIFSYGAQLQQESDDTV